ncbi:hypothetical protein G3I40_09040 [Streptomyces sp. SID14478]|uniref:DUF6207 family protein n=1 Tax=Streptomyces sp. SID14478 TaxID=2706073 RepID=UPI0013DA741B|nr:DUF6207 family protein [Streptomyces sp. SID14478]NEB75372.1 hypothetical protein [Streptomyces sp. SID14478]
MTDQPVYLTQPGLVCITIEGVAPEIVLAAAHELTACHDITGPSAPQPVPGGPGVHVRQYMYARLLPDR